MRQGRVSLKITLQWEYACFDILHLSSSGRTQPCFICSLDETIGQSDCFIWSTNTFLYIKLEMFSNWLHKNRQTLFKLPHEKCSAIFLLISIRQNYELMLWISVCRFLKNNKKHFSSLKTQPMPKRVFIDDHCSGILTLIDDQTPIIGTHRIFFPLTEFIFWDKKNPVLSYGIFSAPPFQRPKSVLRYFCWYQ